MTQVQRIAEVLGGEKTLGRPIRTLSELKGAISVGLPKSSLRCAAERVSRNRAEATALVYRIVPESTFKRRKKLSPLESERSERLARVIVLAEDIWGDPDTAHRWLRNPHGLLEGQSPIQVAESELGAREVEDILHRIDYGLPA